MATPPAQLEALCLLAFNGFEFNCQSSEHGGERPISIQELPA